MFLSALPFLKKMVQLSSPHFECSLLHNSFSVLFLVDYKQLWIYTAALFIPFTLSAYIINGVSMFIVPIMGRSGSGNHAELVLSLIMSVMLMLLFSFYVSSLLYLQYF